MLLNPEDNRRRCELISRQLDSIIRRSQTLPSDHPAQKGITRTIEKLLVEESAAE